MDLFTKRPGSLEIMGRNGYFASEFLACKLCDGKQVRETAVQFNEYLDMNGSENPYFFGVYYPEFEEADADFL